MANSTVTDQRTASLPPDSVFRAGLPVSGRLFAMQAQVQRQLYEALYDEAAPGQDSQTIHSAAPEEYRRAQDHSGIVGGVSHGVFLGRSFPLGLPPRFPALPFTLDDWDDADGADDILTFHGETWQAFAPARTLMRSTGGASDNIYAGHSLLRLRRGTTHLDIQATAWQISDPEYTAGSIACAVFDPGWNHIATRSAVLDIAETLEDIPLNPVQHLCVPVTTDAAPLAEDVYRYLVCGLKIEDLTPEDKTILLQDLLAWECQIPV